MSVSPNVTQTTEALAATDARRPMNRRQDDLTGYAAALAAGLRYAEEENARG